MIWWLQGGRLPPDRWPRAAGHSLVGLAAVLGPAGRLRVTAGFGFFGVAGLAVADLPLAALAVAG